MPKVSVIVPVYNTAPYLEEAIRSIMLQTLKDIEIIAINDGSTDKSLDILKDLQHIDNRLIIYTQENKGLSITRNKGIELATGEYIYFFDSDDVLSRDCLEDCYNKSIKENCDFVCFDAEIFYSKNYNLKSNESAYQRKDLLQSNRIYKGQTVWEILRVHKKASPSVCLNFINRNYIISNNLTFYPNILHEDRLFTFLLYMYALRIKYIPKNYFHRRMRINSITTTRFSPKNVKGLTIVCEELLKYKKNNTNKKQTNLINKEIKDIINTIASSSIHLSFRTRMWILLELLKRFYSHVSIKSTLLLFFPILKIRKRT